MIFGRTQEKYPIQPNESQRRRSTDAVVNESSDILEMAEVQDALERLNVGRLPNLLQKIYIPEVEGGHISANRGTQYIPVVSLYPREKLEVKNNFVSLDSGGGVDALGITISNPQTLIGLAQANANHPTASMALVHELAHAHQIAYNTVNDAAYNRYPHFGSRREVEALNVEAVVASILMKSHDSRWAGNQRLLTPFTKIIRSKQPVISGSKYSS